MITKADIKNYFILTLAVLMCSMLSVGAQSLQAPYAPTQEEMTQPYPFGGLKDSLLTALKASGWLNLRVQASADKLIIAFENRIYRFEARAIKALIKEVAPIIGTRYKTLALIVLNRNVPIMGLSLSLEAWNGFLHDAQAFPVFANSIHTTLNIQADWQLLKDQPITQTGALRTEAYVDPQLRMGLGGYPKPVLVQINLLPTANLYLWRGAQLKAQAIVPTFNQLPIPEDKSIRPGLIGINQYFRLPSATFMGLSAGYFTNYTYGLELELSKILFNGRFIWRNKMGYTGYASFPKRLGLEKPVPGWQVSSLANLDYRSSVEYRLAKYNLVAKIEAGRYLYHQNAVKVSVVRQFRETDIGFFGQKSSQGANYGFQLSIPILSKKYGKPQRFQFRTSKSLPYTYTATQYVVEDYQSGNDLYLFLKKLNPPFIQNQLRNSLDW